MKLILLFLVFSFCFCDILEAIKQELYSAKILNQYWPTRLIDKEFNNIFGFLNHSKLSQ